MMAKDSWIRFERLVAAIHLAESQGSTVTWNDHINGRQFDVTLRFKFGLHDYLTVIECKDYASKVPVEKVDALVTKAQDVNANKVIMVSSNGYQSGCHEVASRHGVRLLTLDETVDIDLVNLASEMIPALNIYDVRLITPNDEEIPLEDEGGKLQYLMNSIRVISKSGENSLNKRIHEWQLTSPPSNLHEEHCIDITLDKDTVARIPYEGEVKISNVKFRCKLITAFLAKGPTLDTHILASMRTKYELIDERGQLIHTATAAEIRLGFDTIVAPGKFYSNPKLYTYYYCESVDKDIVTWILLEAYQHGKLVQVKYTQDIKFSFDYLEISEQKKLLRLRRMLEEYNRRR